MLVPSSLSSGAACAYQRMADVSVASKENSSVWPEKWVDVEEACGMVGEKYGQAYGCLMCSRTFNEVGSLYTHISNKQGHASAEEVNRWDNESVKADKASGEGAHNILSP